tara:strand:- start:19166 stop:20359 length:1194 start_codon:yes stop_codon:yes gene_type:complete
MIIDQLTELAVDISSVKFDPANARKHNKKNIEAIKTSLTKFGQRAPIVVQKEGMICRAGNGRLEAARSLGWDKIAAVIVDEGDVEATAFAITDNRTAELAEWDGDVLGDLLGALDDDLRIGWDEKDLKDIFGENMVPGLTDPDEMPQKVPERVSAGDLWILGNHRLLCGDSTSLENVARLMGGEKADQLITDPPYNVAYVGKTKEKLEIDNDRMSDSDFREFLKNALAAADSVMKPGAVFYIWHPDSGGYDFRGACKDNDWQVRQCLIWNKNHMVMGRQDYHWKHEPCLYGWKKGQGHLWATDRKQVTVLEFDRPSASREHPTMKPVELFAYQLCNNTKEEDLVIDLFLGSGTTIMAAQTRNRRCFGLELDPHYCDVILKRWEDFTGEKAKKSRAKK